MLKEKKTILLVDDSKGVLNILEKHITSVLDVNILKAASFKDALKFILKKETIHIAILDLHLPDAQNGEMVDYAIEKKIPSIVLTSTSDAELREVILKKDIIDYIIKDSLNSVKNVVNLIERTLKNYDTNVLVVEDSPSQLALAIKQLTDIKLNVTSAVNGQEALDLINKGDKKYSLVLTDYNMPIMDGMELTFKLRDRYKKNELAIIVFSSSDNDKIATDFLKIGVNDFINKPYTKLELKTRVNSTLDLIDYFEQVQDQTKKLEEYNITLETKVKEEVKKNIQKELQLFEQSKLASMGSMIGNITHQWRQPLTHISVIASGIILEKNLNVLDINNIVKPMEDIIGKTQYLSEVIHTFRSFLMENKEVKEVILQDRIDISLDILKVVLTDNNIELKNSIDYLIPIKTTMVVGELSEVIINIINNASDILREKKVEDAWIKLELLQEDKRATITIEDNGGGVPQDILPNIFDEYFSTKPKDIGTGLGLYMSHKIVEDSLKGKLFAKNTENGAKFFIELPID